MTINGKKFTAEIRLGDPDPDSEFGSGPEGQNAPQKMEKKLRNFIF
jgi:hypothetical protein